MDNGFSCPQSGYTNPAFTALNEAVLAIAAGLSVEAVLKRIVHASRELVHAHYAALGVPDDEGSFAQFITSGITPEQWDAIGPLPRAHGLLGAMLQAPAPYRTRNIEDDLRFDGWPAHHPHMRSFLGVPIVSKGNIIGAFYLTDKEDAAEFTQADQRLIEMLAPHAAVAIENARLYERSRELSVMEERNRLARDLHDSVTQTLFSMDFMAEAAAIMVRSDAQQAEAHIRELQALGRDATQQLRSLIFDLRPAEVDVDGLVPTLRKYISGLRRVYPTDIELQVQGERRLKVSAEKQIFPIAQEALNNALKHSKANRIQVALKIGEPRVGLTISDDGVGFDPLTHYDGLSVRSNRLGITSMHERAQDLGGSLRIDSKPGMGTKVFLEVEIA